MMFLDRVIKEIQNTWKSMERKLDIDTYEGWLRNGLPLCVCVGLLFIGFCIGLGLLVCKAMGRI
mgnify:CR=1 FL=1